MKNKTPSKELLSKVLDLKVHDCIFINENLIEIQYKFGHYYNYYNTEINIHELAHKCKEFIGKSGYQIQETYGFDYSLIEIGKHGCGFEEYMWRYEESNITPEAIFTACQWILDNRKKELV